MQFPIISAIYTTQVGDVRVSYPVNWIPTPRESGVSSGYLRPADGLVSYGEGPGATRNAINWKGRHYRVMGTKLCQISETGVLTELGDVGSGMRCSMDYSFDRLSIASGGRLYYWNGSALTQVTDPDLGTVIDHTWIDGYFAFTDGVSVAVTELNDPLAINPLKYGSSEIDPDNVVGLDRLRNELAAINRYTIEYFDNVGGDFFPFQRIDGAQVQKGCIGTHAFCIFNDVIAMIGSGRNEPLGVYLAANGAVNKISTAEIDKVLATYPETDLARDAVLEARQEDSHEFLYMHLPDRTLVYDAAASQTTGEQVWFVLTSTLSGFEQYRARDFVWCYDKWLMGDPTSSLYGFLTDENSHHYGEQVRWEFGTLMLYNESRGAILHSLELVALNGRTAFGEDPQISTSYSTDGMTWSQDKWFRLGTSGERDRHIAWRRLGHFRNYRIQRFQGDSQSFFSPIRLEAQLEGLAW